MITRRELLELGAACTLPPFALSTWADESGVHVNDAQSKLNRTTVRKIVQPATIGEIRQAIRLAEKKGLAISTAGGRHSMGGQQFGHDTILIDMSRFKAVADFDARRGQIEVQSGIQWPDLIEFLQKNQQGANQPWAIRQKQTGVDNVSIGGSLASNIHGRGLQLPPFIGDIESFVLLDANGKLRTCSRRENPELFSLAIGGYGLFGIVVTVTLKLVPRTKVERIVELIEVRDLLPRIEERLSDGFVYGDCQYSPDLTTEEPSHPGVFSCYRPVGLDEPVQKSQKQLSANDWARLYKLARTDKRKAFEVYSQYYLGTSGQVYWSDMHQLSAAFEGYRDAVDPRRGTEMITEVYVAKDQFVPFMIQARRDFVEHKVDMTYGTIRFIEQDSESFLPWATQPSVCIVCNLHVVHTEAGIRKAKADFRRILDRAIEHEGSFYLTYHRWATRRQVETVYPRFAEFLRLKKKYDPHERFQSDWYRHYRALFAETV
jgi:FAD/FMN-containing dehydrogenase